MSLTMMLAANVLNYVYIVPYIVACILQLILCAKTKKLGIRLIPIYVAVFIGILVALYQYTSVLTSSIGNSDALFLLGCAVVIITGSIFGWCIYFMKHKLDQINK